MLNINQCPCFDCITLSACRAQWYEWETTYYIPILLHLQIKCCLIEEYLDQKLDPSERYERISKVIEILKPPKPEDIF
jgi:hypothetical protein